MHLGTYQVNTSTNRDRPQSIEQKREQNRELEPHSVLRVPGEVGAHLNELNGIQALVLISSQEP